MKTYKRRVGPKEGRGDDRVPEKVSGADNHNTHALFQNQSQKRWSDHKDS